MNLDQFTGTDNYYRHQSGLLYTDGDSVPCRRGQGILADRRNRFAPEATQEEPTSSGVPTLGTGGADRQAVLTARRTRIVPISCGREIEYTDFPLAYVKVYVEGGILLLPSEH